MKKSTLYFALAVAILFICAMHPPIIGSIYLNKDGQPADHISSLWKKVYDVETLKRFPENIKHIEIIGNGYNSNIAFMEAGDSSVINSENLSHINQQIKNDTLILTITKDVYLGIHARQDIEEIGLNNVTGYLKLKNQDSLSLNIENNSDIFYSRVDTIQIKKLAIQINNKSTFNYNYLISDKITAKITDGAMYYDSSLHTDSLYVDLLGKSIVRCNNSDEVQQVKNLIISGNKQYYKDHFSGKGTHVMLK